MMGAAQKHAEIAYFVDDFLHVIQVGFDFFDLLFLPGFVVEGAGVAEGNSVGAQCWGV